MNRHHRTRTRRTRASRRASAAIDLAFILPMLLTVSLGGIDIGRFAYTYIAVTNAARACAAYASVTPVPIHYRSYWNHAYSRAALDEMQDFDSGKVAVADPLMTTDSNGFQRVRATVSYPFQTKVHWNYLFPLPHQFTLTRSVEMRVVRY